MLSAPVGARLERAYFLLSLRAWRVATCEAQSTRGEVTLWAD